MKKTFTLIWLLFTAPLALLAQQPFQFSQYFQNAVTINPAVAGSEEFLDLKLGYRQQWSGVEGAPETFFVSAHGSLSKNQNEFPYQNNSLRISDPGLYTRLENSNRLGSPLHHGLGGYIANDQQGIFKQLSGFLSYALHIALTNNTTLSLGVSGGINSREINVSGIKLGETEITDPTYEAYLAQQGRLANFNMNTGFFLYSEKYFIGYSAARILQNEIYANVDHISAKQQMVHYGLMGLRVNLNPDLQMVPGLLLSYNGIDPLLYDMNLRFKFNEMVWVGASYRNTQTIAGMAGFSLNNFINLGYSYDYGMANVNDFSSNVHEIMLGFTLFNNKDTTPYMW